MENVSPIISPDRALMLQHLELLFGRALAGRVEITAIHTDKEPKRPARTKFFDVGDWEEAAAFAADVNAQPGWNVYVGAALRNEDVFPGKAAEDSDFFRTYVVWADADDDEQVSSARETYRSLGITPPFIVVTGRTPSKRAQLWWPLENPIDDIDTLRAQLRGIAAALKTDPKVCTGKQLMRLAGGLNWPKKDDRILERTEVVLVARTQREFPVEQLVMAFPPLARAQMAAAGALPEVISAPSGSLGLLEQIEEGREGWTFKYVRARIREYVGTTGAEPDAVSLYDFSSAYYFQRVSQKRPGRGPRFLMQKCIEAVRAFHEGKIPGMGSVEEAVRGWDAQHPPLPEGDPDDPELQEDDEVDEGPFRASDLAGEPPERRWVVKDWIVEGAVNSLYGDGGLGKTLLAQQLACCVSVGAPWLGVETIKGAVLAILCEDDKNELWRRHNEIKASMGHAIGNPFHDVWLWPRGGEDNVLVKWDRDGSPVLGKLAQRIENAVAELNPTLLILDTLADFYGGNEIDRPQVNYFIKTVLGGLIKARAVLGFPLTVLLLGHPSVAGKSTGSGYSGSTAWNNAVRSRMYLARPEEGGSDERVLTRGKANYAKSGDETAIRLYYEAGVLLPQIDSDDVNGLWLAKREVVQAADKAWRTGKPYSAQKGHQRFIYTALAADLKQDGYEPTLVRQAVRECIDEGQIMPSSSNGKRGYRSPRNAD